MMCGGVGETKKGNEEAQLIIDSVRTDLESQAGKSFPKYEAVSFSTQVVAGTNFFVKVKVGESEFAHLTVYRPLSGNSSLQSFLLGKSETDQLL